MNVILGALVRRIKQRAYLDSDEEIARWIEEYCEQSNSHKPVVMQAGSEKQPLKSEPGKYGCWAPIDDEFYSEFNKLQKAALGSEAAVGKAGEDASVSDGK